MGEPLPAEPGKPARQDTEYQRNGVRDLMMICEPKRGWRDVLIMERRTKVEFAHCMRHIVAAYPDAEVIRVVLDNLNTHRLALSGRCQTPSMYLPRSIRTYPSLFFLQQHRQPTATTSTTFLLHVPGENWFSPAPASPGHNPNSPHTTTEKCSTTSRKPSGPRPTSCAPTWTPPNTSTLSSA
ncbi:transposase [Propionivibrio sp.]|uniref:transposase n=1 Tax=Propionivibrio sp. TaxID=2212460 RepID=UPI00345C30B1